MRNGIYYFMSILCFFAWGAHSDSLGTLATGRICRKAGCAGGEAQAAAGEKGEGKSLAILVALPQQLSLTLAGARAPPQEGSLKPQERCRPEERPEGQAQAQADCAAIPRPAQSARSRFLQAVSANAGATAAATAAAAAATGAAAAAAAAAAAGAQNCLEASGFKDSEGRHS